MSFLSRYQFMKKKTSWAFLRPGSMPESASISRSATGSSAFWRLSAPLRPEWACMPPICTKRLSRRPTRLMTQKTRLRRPMANSTARSLCRNMLLGANTGNLWTERKSAAILTRSSSSWSIRRRRTTR